MIPWSKYINKKYLAQLIYDANFEFLSKGYIKKILDYLIIKDLENNSALREKSGKELYNTIENYFKQLEQVYKEI